MMDDGDGGVVVLWWCDFREGSAFECESGVTNGRMCHRPCYLVGYFSDHR